MDERKILAEVEYLLRNAPMVEAVEDNSDWISRASVAINACSKVRGGTIRRSKGYLISGDPILHDAALKEIVYALKETRHEIILNSTGPSSIVAAAGNTFDYFDEIRKIIELATTDLFFIDPYMDAEFASRFFPHMSPGVRIRLLTSSKPRYLSTLVPAAETFHRQSGNAMEIRSNSFHDRFVIIDQDSCYQSGASFKDGAKKDPAIITQIVDAFPSILATYEDLWDSGNVEFSG